MSRQGNGYDHACMESWPGPNKKEWSYLTPVHTREEARSAIFESIEILYNRQLNHSTLGYGTPAEAAQDTLTASAIESLFSVSTIA